MRDDRPLAKDINWSPASDPKIAGILHGAKRYQPSTLDVLDAHRRSWMKDTQIELLNNAGTTFSKRVFLQLLPHSPTARMRYVATAHRDPDTGLWIPKWECLDYAKLWWAWAIALGIYPAGFTLDPTGHHYYCSVCFYDEDIQRYEFAVIEPQGNVIVPKAYPAHHYTGDDRVRTLVY